MSGSVLLHRQRSPEDLQLLRAWYKVRDTLFGQNLLEQDIKKALELACVCDHQNAIWLTKLFAGRDVTSREEARRIFLASENDPRALCFAGVLLGLDDEILRAAELGDAFAQAWMAWQGEYEESFRWTGKSAAQGERDGIFFLGHCYRRGIGCVKDAERGKENFLVAAQLGNVDAMVYVAEFLEKHDPERFVWFGRAAAANGGSSSFLNEMVDQIRKFWTGTGLANVVFAIGRALKGHINNEKRTVFGSSYMFDARIDPATQAFHFYEFQLLSYRKAVDTWTIVGLRNIVVKDIRNMIGKMIWEARGEAAYLERKQSV
jgi:hypothetical protein